MGVPIVGHKQPEPKSDNLITGNSSTFAASIGSWTNSGGTLSWDTTAAYKYDKAGGSLKFVTTAQNDYCQVVVPGNFKAGSEYQALVLMQIEPTTASGYSYTIDLGVIGTDSADTNLMSAQASGGPYGDLFSGVYTTFLARWVPSAARNSVVLRLSRPSPGSGTVTYHIGLARVALVRPMGSAGLSITTTPFGYQADRYTLLANRIFGGGEIRGSDKGAAVSLSATDAWITSDNTDRKAGLAAERDLANDWHTETEGGAIIWAKHTPGDIRVRGITMNVGDDYVGLVISEKDSATVQIYPNDSYFGYDVELVDRGSRHWKAIGSDRSVVLSKTIQNPMQAADDLIIGTTTSFSASTPSLHELGEGGDQDEEVVSVVSVDWPVSGSVTIDYDIWISVAAPNPDTPMGDPTVTSRIRRTNLVGTSLASDAWNATGPLGVKDGHQHHWTGSYVDNSPTDGVYVLTFEITSFTGYPYVWWDTLDLTLTGTGLGAPDRLVKGSDSQALVVDPSTHHLAWKDKLDYFQWPFYVAGSLATGTDKAVYFQVPNKCTIDEVRVHVGTAPTDAALIVDVNDDGTTIFTTQANRPEIATSGTDDTSGSADGGTSVSKDSVLTIDIDQVGSTIAGADLVVFVRGHYIW